LPSPILFFSPSLSSILFYLFIIFPLPLVPLFNLFLFSRSLPLPIFSLIYSLPYIPLPLLLVYLIFFFISHPLYPFPSYSRYFFLCFSFFDQMTKYNKFFKVFSLLLWYLVSWVSRYVGGEYRDWKIILEN
jgi:hypothetical protein